MIYIIVGPTGSGKSGLAVKLARYFNDAPIINADAFQIYIDMNIGTAKVEVGSSEYKLHHLLDIKYPNEDFSVKEYQKLFRDKVNELSKEYNLYRQDYCGCVYSKEEKNRKILDKQNNIN
mgnify:CR=1 FL=1